MTSTADPPGTEPTPKSAAMKRRSKIPSPDFVTPVVDLKKRRMPQCIAHRGYKSKYPENTMHAFGKAVEAGVHALETDVHLTKDDVVVLSHDASLKRCYGVDAKIIDKTWDEIKELRTSKEPHVPMPRLKDVLEYLAQPGLEDIWLLLDIKVDDDADALMRLIGSTVASVSPSANGKPWSSRIVLGIWSATYLPLVMKYLEGFPIVHIGFKVSYARNFLKVPNVGFNMVFPVLFTPWGRNFIRDCQEEYHRKVIAWTVNDERKMEWCIRRNLDGVITDEPEKFLDVCENFDERKKESFLALELKSYYQTAWMVFMVAFLARWFFRKHHSRADVRRIMKENGFETR